MDRQTAQNKKGTISNSKIKSLVKEWHDNRMKDELHAKTVQLESKALESKVRK